MTNSLGVVLAKTRKKLGVKQLQLAVNADTDQPYISDLENGKAPKPTERMLMRIAFGLYGALDDAELLRLSAGYQPLKFMTKEEQEELLAYIEDMEKS